MMRGFAQIVAFARRPWLRRAAMRTGVAAAVVGLSAAAAVHLTLEWAAPHIPSRTDLYSLNRPAAYTFHDERGQVVGRRGAIVGERLKLSDMPAHLPAAFLVMEDRRFYEHDGIDVRALARAAVADVKAMRFAQGGSTITQQLVKILFLSQDRTITRKIAEMAGAIQLERVLTKEQILELYLNRIYLGSGAYGVDGAARIYFGKSAREVTLAEAAMLASLTNAPSLNSPRRDLKASQTRSARVLRALETHGGMSKSEVAKALARPATIVAQRQSLERDYFLDTAAEEARSLAPGAGGFAATWLNGARSAPGDLTIVTTLDSAMQKAASSTIANVMNKRSAASQARQAALIAMRPDGAVRAIVGGRDYAKSPFNRATKAHRSPGSAFKPVVYLTALEKGLARDTIRYDAPITIENWSPENFDKSNAGPVTLEAALARSLNTVAVALGQEVGMASVVATAQRLGISSPLEPNASLALGTAEVTPLELTAAYASFASLGYEAVPYTVTEIRGADGAVLYRRAPREPRRVIATADALAMNAMLLEAVRSGTGRAAAVTGREVGGKTGTSADYRDAWFVGYSAELVAGVWVGNDDATPTKRVTGGTLPAQIWSGFMQGALKNKPATPLPRAEPLRAPLIAENDGEGFLGRLGRFFERMFDADRSTARRPQYAPPPPRYRSERQSLRDRYAYQYPHYGDGRDWYAPERWRERDPRYLRRPY